MHREYGYIMSGDGYTDGVCWVADSKVLSKAKFCMKNEIITYISGGLMSYLKAQRGNGSSWSTDL